MLLEVLRVPELGEGVEVIETFLLTGAPPVADELALIVDTVVLPLVAPADRGDG